MSNYISPHEAAAHLHAKAVAFQKDGDLYQAELLCRSALADLISVCGEKHPDVANARLTLAALRIEDGDFREAEKQTEKALEVLLRIRKNTPVLNRLRVQALCQRGLLRCLSHDLEGALPMLRQAVLRARRGLSPKDPEVAICLNMLALVYRKLRRFDLAAEQLREALEVVEGSDNKHLEGILHRNLAEVEIDRDRLPHALPHLDKAQEMLIQAAQQARRAPRRRHGVHAAG